VPGTSAVVPGRERRHWRHRRWARAVAGRASDGAADAGGGGQLPIQTGDPALWQLTGQKSLEIARKPTASCQTAGFPPRFGSWPPPRVAPADRRPELRPRGRALQICRTAARRWPLLQLSRTLTHPRGEIMRLVCKSALKRRQICRPAARARGRQAGKQGAARPACARRNSMPAPAPRPEPSVPLRGRRSRHPARAHARARVRPTPPRRPELCPACGSNLRHGLARILHFLRASAARRATHGYTG
jgi:hypothetical protein